ncbi:MAG TPA: signal peptidase I [Chloroflexi bacterium]|nr:signal peptidase I [Chloroflexota bacterium]
MTVLIFVLVRGLLVQNFRIEGFSMEPTLHEGQYLIVNKLIYYLHPPQRGDIIVFAFPKGPERDFIKRVIGLPGDTVEIRPGEVLVNGESIQEPYHPESVMYSYPPTTLGPNEYFVLGDNRNNSSDSHTWGLLERKYIIGKAWLSYWPPKAWGLVPNYAVQAREPDAP